MGLSGAQSNDPMTDSYRRCTVRRSGVSPRLDNGPKRQSERARSPTYSPPGPPLPRVIPQLGGLTGQVGPFSEGGGGTGSVFGRFGFLLACASTSWPFFFLSQRLPSGFAAAIYPPSSSAHTRSAAFRRRHPRLLHHRLIPPVGVGHAPRFQRVAVGPCRSRRGGRGGTNVPSG